MAAEATAAKIKLYVEQEAAEPLSLSQMSTKGVFSTLQSKEENVALTRLLESESVGLTFKDMPVLKEGGEVTVRIYWKKGRNKENGHNQEKGHVHSTPSVPDRAYPLVSGSIQPPPVSRCPLVSGSIQPPSVSRCPLVSGLVVQPSSVSRRPFISPARNGRRGGRGHIQKTALNMPLRRNPVPTQNSNRTCDGGISGHHDANALARDILKLREAVAELESEVGLMAEEYSEAELQKHIDKLHEYNEMKDMGQLLLGKLAGVEGTTTAALYQKFGLELDN